MGRDRWGLNKSQRMQMKAFIILLGILLLIILLFGKLLVVLIHSWRDRDRRQKAERTSIQVLTNVWIMELGEDGLLVFQDGESVRYPYGTIVRKDPEGQTIVHRSYVPDWSVREQVADLVLTEGAVTKIIPKTNKINGKILSADAGGIEVEGYGRLPLASDYRGYRLYGSLEMCTVRDLFFGYDFTDLCIYRGQVCGILMAREETMEYIRVLIKASNYSGALHTQPVLTCNTDFTVRFGSYDNLQSEHYGAGEEIAVDADSGYFVSDRIWVIPDALTGKVVLKNCSRSQGTPAYRGQVELLKTDAGIAVINEVQLEEYLYSVVPSEMPAKYPAEALKAQAICARTYAYGCMKRAGYPQYGAHADDSTSYQVYNNILEQKTTTTAVKETYGQLLYTEGGGLAGTYYYSTSCGVGSDANVWKTGAAAEMTYLKPKALSRTQMRQAVETAGEEKGGGTEVERLREEKAFKDFITTKNRDDFESEESWYRWSYQVKKLDGERMLEMLKKRYQANARLVLTLVDGEYVSLEPTELGEVRDIYIEKRGGGGVADELVIETADKKYKVISEHNIRYVLNDGSSKVVRQDGKKIDSPSLLPSGFFVIETGKEGKNVVGYTLTGGGFGHGVGMSQNGAKCMAQSGYTAGDILLFFYENCLIRNMYG